MPKILLPIFALALLPGCIVKSAVDTAADVVTLPVKAGSKAVDLATTSEKEKDAKFMRKLRKQCEAEAKARSRARKNGTEAELPPPNPNCV